MNQNFVIPGSQQPTVVIVTTNPGDIPGYGQLPHGINLTPQDVVIINRGRNGLELPKLVVDASRDGRFTVGQAAKKFAQGLFSPITTILKHPVKAGLAILGGVALATVAPVTVPALLLAGGVFGGLQFAKGALNAVGRATQGDWDGAENAFEDIGAGAASVALTAVGARSSAAIAAEAKAAQAGIQSADNAKKLTLVQALKENVSFITQAEGRAAFINGLKPATLLQNVNGSIAKGREAVNALRELAKAGHVELSGKVATVQSKIKDLTLTDKIKTLPSEVYHGAGDVYQAVASKKLPEIPIPVNYNPALLPVGGEEV